MLKWNSGATSEIPQNLSAGSDVGRVYGPSVRQTSSDGHLGRDRE
ncbi:MAG: hypothetical protein V7724_15490 [Sediminicola sp.]